MSKSETGVPTKIVIHSTLSDDKSCTIHRLRQAHTSKKSKGGLGLTDVDFHFVIQHELSVDAGRNLCYPGRPVNKRCTQDIGKQEYDIHICVIGDCNSENVSTRQMLSLTNLLAHLLERYELTTEVVTVNRKTSNQKAKADPGTKFNLDGLKYMLEVGADVKPNEVTT